MSSPESVGLDTGQEVPALPHRWAGPPARPKRDREPSVLWSCGLIAVGAVAVVAVGQAGIALSTLFVMANMGFFAVAAQGLGFAYGEGGLLSVAHGTLVGMAAYSTILLINNTSLPFATIAAFSILVAIVGASIVAGMAVRLRGHYFLIVTVALAGLASISANTFNFTGKSAGLSLDLARSSAVVWLTKVTHLFYVSWAAVLLGALALLVLRRSRFGRALNGIRENEILARSLGVNAPVVKTATFGVSGLFAGVAGVILAAAFLYVSPTDVSVTPGITYITILLLGGSRSLLGPIVGAVIYLGLPYYFGLSSSALQIATGIIVVVLILVLPQGIMGFLQHGIVGAVRLARGHLAFRRKAGDRA